MAAVCSYVPMIRLLRATGVQVRGPEARVNRFHAIDYRPGKLQKFSAEVSINRRSVFGCNRLQPAHDVLGEPEGHTAEREQRRGSGSGIGPERIHDLLQIHDDLDAAVFDAYGWPHDLTDEQILERLVALNAERAEEERHGIVRWLRPEFQNPAGSKSAQQTTMAGVEIEEVEAETKPKAAVPWPKDLPAQIAAVRDLVTAGNNETWTIDSTIRAFKGAKRPQVQSVLDSLAALGLLVTFGEGKEREWRSAG
jgi:hypothetical protein